MSEWIKQNAGEYKHINGIYTAIKGYTRSYGNNTWSLYGPGTIRKFSSFKELKRAVALLQLNYN